MVNKIGIKLKLFNGSTVGQVKVSHAMGQREEEEGGIRHPRKDLAFIVPTSIPKRSAGEAWPMPSVTNFGFAATAKAGSNTDGCMEELTLLSDTWVETANVIGIFHPERGG